VSDDHVFGYGSLLDRQARATARIGHLTGYRRVWNVAMDNSVDLPGYKIYIDPQDGSRPPVFVTFLNIVPTPGNRVNGQLFPISTEELAALDIRERNYERIDVTDDVEEPVSGRVWAYLGLHEAVARYERGAREQRAVIRRAYHDAVLANCAAAGPHAQHEFDQSTDAPPCPIVDLDRIDRR
jgi:cation transport regulator ChaC